MYKLLRFTAVLALVFYITACNSNEEKNSEPVQKAEVAVDLPNFTVVNAEGTKMNIHDLKGKKVFVNLWATWCPPCRNELPSIQSLYNSTDREKSEFVMLSLDENFQSAVFYTSQEKFSFPIFHPAQNLPELFNVRGIPVTFIFDEAGNLMHRRDGSDNYDTDAYRELLN